MGLSVNSFGLSRFFLSISRLNFSTFSNCCLASFLVSSMSRYMNANNGSIKATNKTATGRYENRRVAIVVSND